MGYSRSDRIRKRRQTIAAADIMRMLEACGVDLVVTCDIHRRQIEGFKTESTLRMEHLSSLPLAVRFFLEKDLFRPVIVCPSASGVERARAFVALLEENGCHASIAFVSGKNRKRGRDEPTMDEDHGDWMSSN